MEVSLKCHMVVVKSIRNKQMASTEDVPSASEATVGMEQEQNETHSNQDSYSPLQHYYSLRGGDDLR